MTTDNLRFTPQLLSKPAHRGWTVETTLRHFAIVSYWVNPADVSRHLHPRFEPVRISANRESDRALISVVTFLDEDFRFVACPWITGTFGQTNYRAYVLDTQTGEYAVWFFGTCLDSVSVVVPRYVWKLPWHSARMSFDCRRDAGGRRYANYSVRTESRWAPGQLDIEDSGTGPGHLPGFSNLEAGLVLLTHPLRGFFFRRDGSLGSYTIWHDRTMASLGSVREAIYPLLNRLELVEEGNLDQIHSVLLQERIDFTIYLPPTKVETSP